MIFLRLWIFPLILMGLLSVSFVLCDENEEETSVKKRAGVHQYLTKPEENINNNESSDQFIARSDAVATRLSSGRKIISLDHSKDNNNDKKVKKTRKNDALLHKVGMAKIKTPAVNHHRKRLASQSRKAQPGDSHMYVIKLPPNPYYYAHEKPLNPQFDKANPEKMTKSQMAQTKQMISTGASFNNVGLNFASNGKPSRIYHWNMPIMKKMMLARKTDGDSKLDTLWDPITISEQSTIDENDDFVHHKVSYYRPKRPSKKTFHKYFPGNGKPHSLYVIEKSKKPKYHRLLP